MAAAYIEATNGITRGNPGLMAGLRDKIAEGFWFSLCLLLFVILGPFSAPIVLAYLFFNDHLGGEMQEPESLSN